MIKGDRRVVFEGFGRFAGDGGDLASQLLVKHDIIGEITLICRHFRPML
jgi:hypothetical protein